MTLRSETDRLTFCEQYFAAVGATLAYSATDYREYVLPRSVDKELTDRPYYWMWVEKTNQPVHPTTLRLAFSKVALDRENQRLRDEAWAAVEQTQLSEFERRTFRPPTAEYVALGSLRLAKICDSVDERGKFACVRVQGANADRFVPWLMVNTLVTQRCDLIEQEYLSTGVCLLTGQIMPGFHDKIRHVPMTAIEKQGLMDSCRVTLEQALRLAEDFLHAYLLEKPSTWADMATQRMQHEIQQLNTYYDSVILGLKAVDVDGAERERARKIHELKARSQPRVDVVHKQLALIAMPERP